MSAKKYLTTTLLVSLLASFSSVFAQDEVANDSETMASKKESPQFLVRTERNGKTKYVGCALPNLYFHKATALTPEEEFDQNESEFTEKGGTDSETEYYGYSFFLVQDSLIIACNESGDFNGQPEGLYTLSRFLFPLSISPESFNGKNIKTVENHPLFEKDPAFNNLIIRLLAPKIEDPTLSTEPVEIAPSENILGQIQVDISTNN